MLYLQYNKYNENENLQLKQLTCTNTPKLATMTNLTETNILLVSHNSSIKCLLAKIIPGSPIEIKNSSIIKLEILNNNKGYLSLVYEGDKPDVNKHKKHWTMEKNTDDEYFASRMVELNNITNFELNNITNKINIYIIRHAQADHNINKNNKIKDTILTKYIGINQANNTGIALKHILNNKPINYMFASKLRRTRQTLGIILGHVQSDPRPIIILPCLNELKMNKSGICNFKIPKKTSFAGQAICNVDTCLMNTNIPDPEKLCCLVAGHIVDWSFYKNYKGNCFNTNIIKLMISRL